jgi:three-Cys-motif partner protein
MPSQAFGGSWTEDKLSRLRKYLAAYATALKGQPFDRLYIDAFAGTGYRQAKTDDDQPHLGLDNIQVFMAGSAQIALEVEPAFQRYIFIEKSRTKIDELRRLSTKFPGRHVDFENRDANAAICDLCSKTNWRRNRAVVFLDPYGAQVEWRTIEAIAATKAIDLWYLFPAGACGRLLPREGGVPAKWEVTLDRLLGLEDWREAFFTRRAASDLFTGPAEDLVRDFDIAKCEEYFRKRLQSAFAGVADRALPLRNSRNVCMYLLFFACGNPRAKDLALRIANHILMQ